MFGVIRGNELDQRYNRSHTLHRGKELLLAGSSGAQLQVKLVCFMEAEGAMADLRLPDKVGSFAECP